MKFLKAEEERGCCPTLRIAQIGGFFATVVQYSTAKQHELSLYLISYNINFLFLCVHALRDSLWIVAMDCCFEFGLPNFLV